MRAPFFHLARIPPAAWRRLRAAWSTFGHLLILDRVGRGTLIHGGCRLFFPGTAEIGARCHFDCDVTVGAEIAGNCLRIGDDVQINRNCQLDISADLTIEDAALISEGAVIYTHSHGLDPRSRPTTAAKRIGRGAWIGQRAVVLASCTDIGAGAVIGAGAIVTRDVEPYTIVAGVPARVLGHCPGEALGKPMPERAP